MNPEDIEELVTPTHSDDNVSVTVANVYDLEQRLVW